MLPYFFSLQFTASSLLFFFLFRELDKYELSGFQTLVTFFSRLMLHYIYLSQGLLIQIRIPVSVCVFLDAAKQFAHHNST
jgi:hypothetical protein